MPAHEVNETHPSSQRLPPAPPSPPFGSLSATHPVDDVHQVLMTRALGMDIGEDIIKQGSIDFMLDKLTLLACVKRTSRSLFAFCRIEVFSAQSDHCMAMGCRIRGYSGPGINRRRPGDIKQN